MILRPISEPGPEPISSVEAAEHLRIDYYDEVALQLELFIRAARERAEERTGRALVDRTWELVLDKFPAGPIEIRKVPLVPQSVEISYIDYAGEECVMASSDYVVVVGEPARIGPASSWPGTRRGRIGAVTVRFDAGPRQKGVPAILRSAMLLHIGDMFEHREDTIVGASVTPRRAIDDIYDEFLVGRRYA